MTQLVAELPQQRQRQLLAADGVAATATATAAAAAAAPLPRTRQPDRDRDARRRALLQPLNGAIVGRRALIRRGRRSPELFSARRRRLRAARTARAAHAAAAAAAKREAPRRVPQHARAVGASGLDVQRAEQPPALMDHRERAHARRPHLTASGAAIAVTSRRPRHQGDAEEALEQRSEAQQHGVEAGVGAQRAQRGGVGRRRLAAAVVVVVVMVRQRQVSGCSIRAVNRIAPLLPPPSLKVASTCHGAKNSPSL